MIIETIDRQEAIQLFRSLMSPASQKRILFLEGESRMGKSHLLYKVFPSLVREQLHTRTALLDLRNPLQTIPDILNSACSQLGSDYCNEFLAASKTLMKPQSITIENVQAFFSHITIRVKDRMDVTDDRDVLLTSAFVRDLSTHDDIPFLLLFDDLEQASETQQSWLMDVLLPQLSMLNHVRVVIAGRSIPQVPASYMAWSTLYRLLPINNVQDYIDFSRKQNVPLTDETIRTIAILADHNPGNFVQFIQTVQSAGMSNE